LSDLSFHSCPTCCNALRTDGRLGRARPELAAVAFGVNVLGIKGPRKMMALLPRLPEGSAAVTGYRPSPYGKTALLDRCERFDQGICMGLSLLVHGGTHFCLPVD